MIPALSQAPAVSQQVLHFLQVLRQGGFTGDDTTCYADRLTMATDNSIYQLLPDAVLFPRTTDDVALLVRVGQRPEFATIVFTPRGGGTGTNGQALNRGVIVDMSRYMTQILEINPELNQVRVQAGVVKDKLNQFLRPYGYFFSPELSTSNRATLGGMINTDASGQGSLVYGKTSDHVTGLRVVLMDGEILDTCAMPVSQAHLKAQQNSQSGRIYKTVLERCALQRQLIVERFPELNRFLTGYDLRHVFNDDLSWFDLTRILTGSEGTLAFITEATLDITPLPKVRRLVNVKYDSFDSALRNAPFMLKACALSVETVDSRVLDLAREDIVWHSVRELITDEPDSAVQGLNIVEFAGDDETLITRQLQALCNGLNRLLEQGKDGVMGWQVCNHLSDIERIYSMRKKAVGLLGNVKGSAKPIPFAEDTCVPPEHLAEYIGEFRALLDAHGLDYGMFGHVDAGVLHVRPALDMCDPQQEKLMKQLSDEVVALTRKYGGLLWGEHGKGFRAEYSPAFFGDELYHELRLIKAAFDPDNRLNPGKICPPAGTDAAMMRVDAVKRGTYDRQIPLQVRRQWRGAMECNGNGLCFNFDVNSPMCPSLKVSASRIHSPKGRATLVREWLRLLTQQGVQPEVLQHCWQQGKMRPGTLISRIGNSWRARRGEYDFSHEVKEAMNGCLSCKACASQCPVKIDVPEFRARFLYLYHGRYLRPVRDYLVAGVERYTPLLSRAPKTVNFFLRRHWLRRWSEKYIGMVDLPLLSTPTLKQRLTRLVDHCLSPLQLERLPAAERQKTVLIVQDPFTSYYEAQVVEDFIRLVIKLGFRPVLLPFSANGKAQHIKGFLPQFARTAQKTAARLTHFARLGMPMVGVDPALVLCYRDEYKQAPGLECRDFQVLLVHEWLSSLLTHTPAILSSGDPWYLFSHCTEITALPDAADKWTAIFSHWGAELKSISTGCCGMAGTYGHEVKHYASSLGIYQLSWQKALQRLPQERCLATGYSCRSQVKRTQGMQLRHPLQALLEIL